MKNNNYCILVALVSASVFVAVLGDNDNETVPDDSEEVAQIQKTTWDPTLVTVLEGKLRGLEERAVDGKVFYSFRGIPYAKPPVGTLRFQPPEAGDSWTGVRGAAEEPPACPQMARENLLHATPFTLIGQEDCLYLSVFSPMPQLSSKDALLPVMVFIHGGAYFHGHASQYPPYNLLTQDIVLVVIQYRLGTLGFLSTEDDTAPGNMGILDQTLALNWVQTNAATFSGNPLQITLVGQDTGAASAHLQLLSHTSLGLFHRAIMMSGNALTTWALGTNHRNSAYFIAKMLDCQEYLPAGARNDSECRREDEDNPDVYNMCLVEEMSSELIMECLRHAPLEVLTESVMWFIISSHFPITMGPRVHKNLLMQDPIKLVKEGRFKKIDTIFGNTRDDGAFITMGIYSNEGLRSALRFRFEEMGPLVLDFNSADIAPLNQTISIFDRYVRSNDFELENADGLTAMLTDRMVWYSTDAAVQLQSQDPITNSKKKKVFAYEFAHRGKNSFIDEYPADIGQQWVTRGDDLIYLFGGLNSDGSFGAALEDENDQSVRDNMVKMWATFVATGSPVAAEDALQWLPVTRDSSEVMVISHQSHMAGTKDQERAFWRQLPLKLNLLLFPETIANLTKIETKQNESGEAPPENTDETIAKTENNLKKKTDSKTEEQNHVNDVPQKVADPFAAVQRQFGEPQLTEDTQPADDEQSSGKDEL